MPAEADLRDWRRSPRFDTKPSADLAPAASDNNGWAFVHAGTPTPPEAAGWRVYRTVLTPRRAVAARGGELSFASIGGMASLWVDGKLSGLPRVRGANERSTPCASILYA